MSRSSFILLTILFFFSVAPAQTREYGPEDSIADRSSPESIEQSTATNGEGSVMEQDPAPDTSLYLNELYISPDSVRKWKDAKEFAYINSLDSLLKALKDQENQQPQKRSRTNSDTGFLNKLFSSGFVQVILWAIAACFVLFIILRLFLSEGAFRRQTKASSATEAEVEEEEITADTDFDALISQALRQNNFRLAVRYQYLRALHKLAAKQLLALAPDKTNYQYVREMKDPALQNEFAALTLNYEYVWYGEFSIDTGTYQKIENLFNSFNRKI